MEIKITAKFELGEIVKVKGASQRFLINNIIAETCPGGTQILYKGLLLYPKDSYRIGTTDHVEWFLEKEYAMNENLLEKLT